MKQQKYYYNNQSANFEPVQANPYKKVLFIGLPVVALLLGVLFSFYFFNPNTNIASNDSGSDDLQKIKQQYELLNSQFNQTKKVLADLEQRDNNIYREYFQLEKISDDVRKAGFGGTDRYAQFSDLTYADLVIQTTKNLDILNKQLLVQSKSLDEINAVAKKKEKLFNHIPAIQPVANKELKRLASGYGMRLHPILKIGRMHWGMDFKADTGTPIYATADAVVDRADRMGGYGNVVVLNHGNGYETLYAHMSKHNVTAGQQVKRGDVIGYVGNTGLSSGPHLHYEVHKNKEKVNPIDYYFNDISPDEYKVLYNQSEEMSVSLD